MRWLDDITNSMCMSLSKLGDSEGRGSLTCCSTWGCRVCHDLANEQIKVILCVFFKNNKDINWMPLTLHLGTGVLTWFGCLRVPQMRGRMGNTPGLLQLPGGAEMGTQRQVRVAPSGAEAMEPGRGLRGALVQGCQVWLETPRAQPEQGPGEGTPGRAAAVWAQQKSRSPEHSHGVELVAPVRARRAFNAQENSYQVHGDSCAMMMSQAEESCLAGSTGLCTVVPIPGGMEGAREPRRTQSPQAGPPRKEFVPLEKLALCGAWDRRWGLCSTNVLDKMSRARKRRREGGQALEPCKERAELPGLIEWEQDHRDRVAQNAERDNWPQDSHQTTLCPRLSRSCLAGGSGDRPWSLRGQGSASISSWFSWDTFIRYHCCHPTEGG